MATINILGDIGASVQAEDIITQIQEAKGDKIKVLIASPGGSAFQGLMIHDALKASGKEVTTIALGLCASAAFIIFLAGDKREMGDASLLMGHNSRTELAGTAAQIRDDLEAMDAIDDRMKAAVMAASGMSDEDATKLLSKDTFMNLKTAMDLGLATDSIQDDIAASLNMNKKTKKEPVKMADEETKETGFIAFLKAFLKSEAKAEHEDEKKPEDEEAKAESEDEDVEVEYDPNEISYEELLDVFWKNHNPTTLNRQGPDIGIKYRYVIFYHNDEQKEIAEKSKQTLEKSRQFENPIITEIVPTPTFYDAEEYHQKYFKKHGLS